MTKVFITLELEVEVEATWEKPDPEVGDFSGSWSDWDNITSITLENERKKELKLTKLQFDMLAEIIYAGFQDTIIDTLNIEGVDE